MSDTAREAVQALVNGTAEQPASGLGDWQAAYDDLWGLYTTGGKEKVRTVVSGDRKLRTLLASGTQHQAQTIIAYPPLPAPATAAYDHLAPCGFWLDDYVRFASDAVPMMAASFHQVGALVTVATAIARRLVFREGTRSHYPNMYALFIADSGHGKTTSFNIIQDLIQQAGLDHLLLTSQMSPENLLTQLSTVIPPTFSAWEPPLQEQWIKERAFSAQRGWMIDEASFFFDSLQREYMTGMLGHILGLYDNPIKPISRETQSGGRVQVRNPSLSFFGATTPRRMLPHLRNEIFWQDGLWPRFILLQPHKEPEWTDSADDVLHIPRELVNGLQRIYRLFPVPSARIVKDEDSGTRYVEMANEHGPSHAQLATGVWEAWKVYHKATSHDMRANIDERLRPAYQRFASHAIKAAMLLATMDCESLPVTITLAHYARGQQLAEEWRREMHHLWETQTQTHQIELSNRILTHLRNYQRATRRDICRALKVDTRDVQDCLDLLQQAGEVEAIETRNARNRKVIIWTAE
jgi:hypothetical protein